MGEIGMVLVYTGDGKGKTTAALGLCVRALGWAKKVCVIQFLKSKEYVCGERIFLEQQGVPCHTMGIGFSWTQTPMEQKKAVEETWAFVKKILCDERYELVVLDEINHILKEGSFFSEILNVDMVIDVLKNRPITMDVVLTGRNARKEICDFADLVTEMKAVKHPYEKGTSARKAMEF